MKELGWWWVLQQLMETKSLSEEDKPHNQTIILSPRSEFLGELVISSGIQGVSSWIKWLFLMVFFLMLQWFFLNVFPWYFLITSSGILLHYIVLLYSIPPSTCLLFSFVLEFLSPFPQLFDFLGVKVVENTVQRSSPH